MRERKMDDSCARSIELRSTLPQFGKYSICVKALTPIEFFAALLEMTAEAISLFEQSKRCGKNIGLISVCTA